jgi:tripartite-type tricarboxylate transporter receptor subunit TctC
LKPRFLVGILSTGLMVLGTGVACGQQNYPNEPIRIVTSAAGGGNDFIARLIAQQISGPLGQPVIVENRPSNLTPEIVSHASPDG